MRRAWTLIVAATIAMAGFAQAAIDNSASFLKIPVTAEAMSLGGVLPTQVGPEAIFTNPSGLDVASYRALTLTHAALDGDTRLDALGASVHLNRNAGTLGLSVVALTQNPLTSRDSQGRDAGSYQAYDAAIGLSWSKAFGDNRLGLTAKHLRQAIGPATAAGYAADLGVQRRFNAVSAGFSAQNLGPSLKFVDEASALPLALSAGLSYGAFGALLINLAAQHQPHANRSTVSGGAEVMMFQRNIALRLGYLAPVVSRSLDSAVDPFAHVGLGVGWRFLDRRLKADYSMVPGSRDLGMSHRLTLQWAWSRSAGASSDRFEPDEDYVPPFFQSAP